MILEYKRPGSISTKEIQRIFKASELSQEAFARILNTGVNSVRRWLDGTVKTPHPMAQERLIELREQLIKQGLMLKEEK